TKLRDRLRGIQAHITIEARSAEGMERVADKMKIVERLVGDKIEAMSPVVETFAMLQFKYREYDEDGFFTGASPPITRVVRLIGIDPRLRSETGEFGQFLQNPANRKDPIDCFRLQGEAEQRFNRYFAPARQSRPLPDQASTPGDA